MANIVAESIDRGYVSFQEAPLDKRTLYQTKAEFLSADENKYVETFVSFPPPGHTEIITKRFIGQKVVIQADPENNGKPQEYWFRDGITDANLVKYDSYEWENLEPGTGGGGNWGGGGSLADNAWQDISISNFHSGIDLDKSEFVCKYNPASKSVFFTGRFYLKQNIAVIGGLTFCKLNINLSGITYFMATHDNPSLSCVPTMILKVHPDGGIGIRTFTAHNSFQHTPEFVFSVMLPTST